jgi:hypothetical protein
MPADSPPGSRRLLLAVAALVMLAAGGVAFQNLFLSNRKPPVDFVAFWVGGDLAVHGHNPYYPPAVRARQREVGHDADAAVMMWNPPWVLTLVMPFALVPYGAAYGLWALAHIALILAATELLWRGFAPTDPQRRERHMKARWVAYLVGLSFVPTTYLIGIGQITAVVILGLAGFVLLSRAGRPFLAGAAVAVTAVKPHLLTVFATWLLLEALCSRAGRLVVAGGVLVGIAACLPPTLVNPGVWGDYARALTAPADADHYSPADWTTPVIGSWVRASIPGQPFWVQFVPPILAVVAFGVWYLTGGRPRSEADRALLTPWIVAGSLLVAPYGGWPFDLVLLLPLIFATAARVVQSPRLPAIAVGAVWLAAVNVALLYMMVTRASSELYIWATPTVLVGTLVVWRLAVSPAPVPAPVAVTTGPI